MARIIFLVCLALSCVASGEDVVGWRMPLERYAERAEGLPKLKKAPELSPFFGPKDELYDLSKIEHSSFRSRTSWMVWNATSKTIVVKAGWDAIGRLDEVLGTPAHQCRVKVEILAPGKDGAPPSASSKVLSSISAVCRPDMDFEASRESGGGKILVKGKTTWMGAPARSLLDLKTEILYSPAGQPELSCATNLTMKPGGSMWVARDAADGNALDIRVTVGIESVDGVPLERWLMRQEDGGLVPIIPHSADLHDPRKVSGGMLVADRVVLSEWNRLPGAWEKSGDPFGGNRAFPPAITTTPFPDIQPPAAIREWIDHAVLDVREYVGEVGLKLDPEDFLGYDTIGNRMFLYTASESAVNHYHGLFQMGLHAERPPRIILTAGNPAVMRMVSCSGLPAVLQRTGSDGGVIRKWESRLVAGEQPDLVELEVVRTDAKIQGGERRRIRVSLKSGDSSIAPAEGTAPGDEALQLKVQIGEP